MKPYAFGFSLVVLMGLLAICGCSSKNKIPEGLIGVWEADKTSTYRGASFEITKLYIIFRNKQGREDRNIIEEIRPMGVEKNKDVYDIRYRNSSGGVQTLSVIYFPGMGKGAIRFRNQPEFLWSKTNW